MINQVADAFERKDYRTAGRLLKQLVKQEPDNPMVRLYIGRLYEATGKLDEAEAVYRKLLRDTTNPKIMSQARQGLGRLEAMEKEQRRQAFAQASTDPSSTELGVLILEPIDAELKQKVAQKFARIVQLDAYTARLQLPSRGWRLYRTGPLGELQVFVSLMRQAEIPCFSASLADIEKINIFNVQYLGEESQGSQSTAMCQNAEGQVGSLTFNWSEVTRRVEGLLPLFEEVVDLDARRRLQRKTKTLDYVQFCDLHLPGRDSILRLCDRHYQFQQGMAFSQQRLAQNNGKSPVSSLNQSTTRRNWNTLLAFLNYQIPKIPVLSDFTTFAETAIDFKEMLSHLSSHIDLSRDEETPWDSAFQLYSGLVFVKNASEQAHP